MQSNNSNKSVINVEDVYLLFERVHNFYSPYLLTHLVMMQDLCQQFHSLF